MASPQGGGCQNGQPSVGVGGGTKHPEKDTGGRKDLLSGFTAHCKEETEKSLRGRVCLNGPDVQGDRQSSGPGPRCLAREKA